MALFLFGVLQKFSHQFYTVAHLRRDYTVIFKTPVCWRCHSLWFFFISVSTKKRNMHFSNVLYLDSSWFFSFFFSNLNLWKIFRAMFFMRNVRFEQCFSNAIKTNHKDLFVIMVWNVITKHCVAPLYLFFCSSFLKRNKPEAMALVPLWNIEWLPLIISKLWLWFSLCTKKYPENFWYYKRVQLFGNNNKKLLLNWLWNIRRLS